MTVSSIQRDWGQNPSIVRMISDSFIEDIVNTGWLGTQQPSINVANNGGFDWLPTDMCLVSYPLDQDNPTGQQAKTFVYVLPNFQSVNPISPIYPNLQNITAHAGGGQANATQLNIGINTVSVSATAGDSVLLPLDTLSQTCIVANLGAQSINVFPRVGDSINNQAVNTSFAIAPGSCVIFIGVATNRWMTII